MDSILHYTNGPLTLLAVVSFVVAFIGGAWAGAKWNLGTPGLIGTIAVSLAMFYLRSTAAPLSLFAIGSVTVLHITCGYLTARFIKRFSLR